MRVMGVKKNRRVHPIYSAEFKKEVLQTLERENLTVTEIARIYGISDTSVMNWRSAHRKLGEAGLVNQFQGWTPRDGIPAPVRQAIVEAKKDHPESGTRRIRDFLSRFKFLGVSKQAVATTLRAEGLLCKPPKSKAHGQKPKRFERALPMDLWQSDIMTFHLKRFYPVYLIGFMDDCSRFIVGWGLYRQQTGQAVCDVLLGAIGEHGLPKELLTDNGRQYYAWRGKTRFQEILEQRGIRHIRSRPHHPQTLGKIESFWGHLWREFLQKAIFESFEDAVSRIGHWIKYHNYQRTHQGIEGLVPADRFFQLGGKVKEAMKAGIEENAKALAEKNPVRKPFFMTGRFGDKDLIIRQEGDELVVDLGTGTPERIKVNPLDDGRPVLTRPEMERVVSSSREQEVQHAGVTGREPAPAADPLEPRPENPSCPGGSLRPTQSDGSLSGDGSESGAVLRDGPRGDDAPRTGAVAQETGAQTEGARSGERANAPTDRITPEGEGSSGDPVAGGPAGDHVPGA